MSLIFRSPSCNKMDLANYFALIFKLEPSINAIGRAKLLYRYVWSTIQLTRKVVSVEHLHFKSIGHILRFNIESSLFIPHRLLAPIIDSLSLVFLLAELKNCKWILIAKGVKVTFQICFKNLKLKDPTSGNLRLQLFLSLVFNWFLSLVFNRLFSLIFNWFLSLAFYWHSFYLFLLVWIVWQINLTVLFLRLKFTSGLPSTLLSLFTWALLFLFIRCFLVVIFINSFKNSVHLLLEQHLQLFYHHVIDRASLDKISNKTLHSITIIYNDSL